MQNIKQSIKSWIPPAITRRLEMLNRKGIYFEGSFDDWNAAAAHCEGYGDESILARVLEATLKVKRGEASYERDSALFAEPEYDWPVTTALLWAAVRANGSLHVVDYGGSLGSSYFQNRLMLCDIPNLNWSVIEQPHYVQAGRKYIADGCIQFYESTEYNFPKRTANVILLSAVLQYLPNPEVVIKQVLDLKPSIIIIDKTIVNKSERDSIHIQRVPAYLYKAAYPCRSFSEIRLLDQFTSGFKLVGKFQSLPFPALHKIKSEFVGYILNSAHISSSLQ
jgi:putative methyltransferase (TIGR04325 family)